MILIVRNAKQRNGAKDMNGIMNDSRRIQSCIDHIKSAVDVDPWAKILCEKIVMRAIPVKPSGTYTSCRCGVCGTRVRSGQGSSSFTKDTVCRKCFTVIDWSEE